MFLPSLWLSSDSSPVSTMGAHRIACHVAISKGSSTKLWSNNVRDGEVDEKRIEDTEDSEDGEGVLDGGRV